MLNSVLLLSNSAFITRLKNNNRVSRVILRTTQINVDFEPHRLSRKSNFNDLDKRDKEKFHL